MQRLGSDKPDKVDVRVVAATHRDLRAMVADGRFRQDLYYRLKVVELGLPPLRERRDDIPRLVEAFLREPRKGTSDDARFSPDAMALLVAHDWPGHVRELRHVVERARVLASGPILGRDRLPPELVPPDPAPGADDVNVPRKLAAIRAAAVAATERQYLVDLLERAGGNISLASRESGIHRSYLQRLMTKYGLRQG